MILYIAMTAFLAVENAAENAAFYEWVTRGGAGVGGVSALTVTVQVWKYLKGLREENANTQKEIKTNREESETRHKQSMESHNGLQAGINKLESELGTVNTTVAALATKVEGLEDVVQQVDKTTIEIQGELKLGEATMNQLRKDVDENKSSGGKRSATIHKNSEGLAALKARIGRDNTRSV